MRTGAAACWLVAAGALSACGASQPEQPRAPAAPAPEEAAPPARSAEPAPSELVRIERELQHAGDAWSRVAWGAPQDEGQRAETSRRACCVWDELTRAGRDPVPDLECLLLRMRAMTQCHAATPSGETPRCEDAYASACATSADFSRAAETVCARRVPRP